MWRGLIVGLLPGLVGCQLFEPGGPFGGPTQISAGNTQPQVFEGTASIGLLPAEIEPDAVLAAFETNDIGQVARLFARPPIDPGGDLGGIAAPGIENGYVERWVFEGAVTNAQLTGSGFLMHHDGGSPATCDTIDAVIGFESWANDSGLAFAQQPIDYVEPPPSPVDALEMAFDAYTYLVYQPNDDGDAVVRGWLFRVAPPRGSTIWQDHWLLADDYEPLGDGGTYAIVIPEEATEPSALEDWYSTHSGEAGTYAETTYAIEAFPEDCSDAP